MSNIIINIIKTNKLYDNWYKQSINDKKQINKSLSKDQLKEILNKNEYTKHYLQSSIYNNFNNILEIIKTSEFNENFEKMNMKDKKTFKLNFSILNANIKQFKKRNDEISKLIINRNKLL
jgi:hypothetical protein